MPPTALVDAHHHVWDAADLPFDWMRGLMAPLAQPRDVAELASLLEAAGVTGTVLVEAGEPEQDPARLLAWAATMPTALGVVIGLPGTGLLAPDLASTLDRLRDLPAGDLPAGGLLAGVRWSGLTHLGAHWADDPLLARGLDVLERRGLVLDVNVRAPEMPALQRMAVTRPGLVVVVDHLGKAPLTPREAAADGGAWAAGMAGLGMLESLRCKISGLVHRAAAWPDVDVAGAVEHVLDTFGPGRTMLGSDWPVCTLTAGYGQTLTTYCGYLVGASVAERHAVEAGTATATYNRRPVASER